MHLEFDSASQRCKAYNDDGTLWEEFAMSDHAVNGPGFGFRGRIARGTYPLGRPVEVHDVSMGNFFTPILSVPGRSGLGIHGGGTGCPEPFAPSQPLLMTLGCLRCHNIDNERLAPELQKRYDAGEKSEITIGGP